MRYEDSIRQIKGVGEKQNSVSINWIFGMSEIFWNIIQENTMNFMIWLRSQT